MKSLRLGRKQLLPFFISHPSVPIQLLHLYYPFRVMHKNSSRFEGSGQDDRLSPAEYAEKDRRYPQKTGNITII